MVRAMVSRRMLFAAVPALALGCKAKASEPVGPLDPSDSVDPAFTACGASCGLHSARERKLAKSQPGLGVGDVAFCPVSGAVFRVKEDSPQRIARGRQLWFCCEACATFFSQHETDVLTRRGIS